MFCSPGLVFGDAEGVGSRFHVLRSHTRFRRFRGSRVSFSCFVSPYSFLAVPSVSGPVFMFCDLILVFDGSEGVGSHLHVFCPRTHFWRYRRCQVPFSCFALPNSFLIVPTASAPIFMFCLHGHVFGSAEGVGPRFHVLLPCIRFWRYRGRQVPFSCFALPDTFSAVRRASGSVFIFCASRLVFSFSEGVESRFHVLRPHTHFRQYRRRPLPLSCFAPTDTFVAMRRVSGPISMFCAHGLLFGVSDGVGSHFHVLRPRTRFRRYRGHRIPFSCFTSPYLFSAVPWASGPVFLFYVPVLVFGGSEGVGSRFQVLHFRTRFQRIRGRRVPFSCFALRDTISAVPSASGPVFIFCVPGLILGDTEGVKSRFHVLPPRTRFRQYRRRRVPF
jgi:hypothetical protein